MKSYFFRRKFSGKNFLKTPFSIKGVPPHEFLFKKSIYGNHFFD